MDECKSSDRPVGPSAPAFQPKLTPAPLFFNGPRPDARDGMLSPAFVCDTPVLQDTCQRFADLCADAGVSQFFPLKCHSFHHSLKTIEPYVAGFAASSLFEAKLGREVAGPGKRVHITTPGLRPDEMAEVAEVCDGISFNSLTQWAALRGKAAGAECALRVNPELSFVKDSRYDPCKPHSRLGAPLSQIENALADTPELFDGISSLHFHNNCNSATWQPMLATVKHLDARIPRLLERCKWVNLGGGYVLGPDATAALKEAASFLHARYGIETIIEPGAGMVREAWSLTASVVDLFSSGGRGVAVLDTTVNHMPEVFEYRWSPPVAGHAEGAPYRYIFEGATCLAGDYFGEYSFHEPLVVGSRVTFTGIGDYTLVKAHMFNGVNLPAVYAIDAKGKAKLLKKSAYADFKRTHGVKK